MGLQERRSRRAVSDPVHGEFRVSGSYFPGEFRTVLPADADRVRAGRSSPAGVTPDPGPEGPTVTVTGPEDLPAWVQDR